MKPLPLLLTLVASLTLAATPLEAARVAAGSARAQVDGLRREQLALRGELGALSGRIEALKGARADSGELDAALKRSQALSSTLTGLAQSLVEAERHSEQAHLALLGALSAELTRLRGLFDATQDRARRAPLLAQLRAVRAEQERVRLLLPPALLPPVPAGAATGDDPEDLLEQADALRDSEDRLRQRLQQVEGRLREAREERALLRRMDDFLGAEAMFDEQDRRVRRGEPLAVVNDVGGPEQRAPVGELPPVGEPGPGLPTINNAGDPLPGPQTLGGARDIDRRPQVGMVRRGALAEPGAGDVEALEALRKQLEAQARSLGQRAAELERRARELE